MQPVLIRSTAPCFTNKLGMRSTVTRLIELLRFFGNQLMATLNSHVVVEAFINAGHRFYLF